MGPFDRFNDSAKRVIALSQDEAIRFNHNYIGTEHLILGLAREGTSVAAQTLESLGADLSKMRTAVQFIIPRGDATTSPSEITLSPRTRKVFELAIDEARTLGRAHVGPEHLLLGLVREGEGIAAGVLESLGIQLMAVRAKLLEALDQRDPAAARASAATASQLPFDRLEESTRRVIALAQNEAIGLQQTWVGTEHLVLGLITANGTIAQTALRSLGVTAEAVRERVAALPAPGAEWRARELRLTLLAERILERQPRHWRARTPHGLLFAIVGEAESQGAQILAALGASADKVREEIVKLEPRH